MMSTTKKANKHAAALHEALDRFETRLHQSPMPGKLALWAGRVRDSLLDLEVPLQRGVRSYHPSHFAQIIREDPALMFRVEELTGRGEEILREFDRFRREIVSLVKRSAIGARRDDEIEVEAMQIATRGRQLVVQIRMLEKDVTNWFSEAFYRDRGVAG